MSRKTILGVFMASTFGAMIHLIGGTLGMWQVWVAITLYVANGINERTK